LGTILFALFFCVVGMVFLPFATPNIAFLAVVLLGFAIRRCCGLVIGRQRTVAGLICPF
jgi:hypothetical protein